MVDIVVLVDDKTMREYLREFTPQSVNKVLRTATTRAGAAMKAAMKPAIPVHTGNLRGSLSARRVRSNPGIGVVVGPMGRKAAHRALVVGGTRAHVITPRKAHVVKTPFGVFARVHHPGAKPNRWIDRVERGAYEAGFRVAEDTIFDATK